MERALGELSGSVGGVDNSVEQSRYCNYSPTSQGTSLGPLAREFPVSVPEVEQCPADTELPSSPGLVAGR